MTQERIDTEWNRDKWNELKELIDRFDDSRRHSKKHYSQIALQVALEELRSKVEEQEDLEEQKNQIDKELSQMFDEAE